MSSPRSPFLRAATERGFLHQCTDLEGLDKRLMDGPLTGYIGFDCTADSLHIGSLLQIMIFRLFQKTGNKPLVLMGGGTTKIGDPSGRDETRKLLTVEEIGRNKDGITRIFERFLEFGDGPSGAVMADNAEWLDELRYIPLLREIGRHFSVNRMLTMDSVRLRLERDQPLTFLEFNYMILQSYDFLELARRHDCRLQMGGSDQWGNIVMGAELGRRIDDRGLFGLTTPLIATASGAKMGKTAAGAVWLTAERVSPSDYWQYWRRTEDADVGRFLRLFTELPIDEISRLERLQGGELNDAKKILADEATALAHGQVAAVAAAEIAFRVFVERRMDAGLRTVEVTKDQVIRGISVIDIIRRSGYAASNSEARRRIRARAIKINGVLLMDETANLKFSDFSYGGVANISVSKKENFTVHLNNAG